MRKIILSFLLSSIVLVTNADLTSNGYYRVMNYGSSRFCTLIDKNGRVDVVGGTADLHAIKLIKDKETILSDPGSIVYLTKISGKQYDVAAQGTSLESVMNNPVSIGPEAVAPDGQRLYYLYGTYHGTAKYIIDENIQINDNIGKASISEIPDKYENFRKWEIIPVQVNSLNYFGAVPSLNINGNLYCTLFTSFAYKPYSSGVKAYYIGRVGFGMAEMIEITGAVPTGSPVIIQCAGPDVADNKLELTGSPEALPNNALNGTYFNYKYLSTVTQVVYDPETMRVLGVCSDGSLGFVTSDIDVIPANTAYLKVPKGSSKEFKCVAPAQYDANIPVAPEQIFFGDSYMLQPQDDYTYSGTFYDFPAGEDLSFLFYTSSDKDPASVIGAPAESGNNVLVSLSTPYPFEYGSMVPWVYKNWTGDGMMITLNIRYNSVSFTGKSGVESIKEDSVRLEYYNSTVYSGAGSISVLNLGGQVLATSHNGMLDISNLPKGIYIAVSGGKSIKILR